MPKKIKSHQSVQAALPWSESINTRSEMYKLMTEFLPRVKVAAARADQLISEVLLFRQADGFMLQVLFVPEFAKQTLRKPYKVIGQPWEYNPDIMLRVLLDYDRNKT